MPRVSAEHLAARREQILSAARRCFLRNGFHATSMQDVITEAGLFVGAVYRYFRSKNEIISAIAEETMAGINEVFRQIAAQEPPYHLIEAMDRALDMAEAQTGADGVFRLAMQVWAEAVRDPALAESIAGKYEVVRATLTTLASQARARGELPAQTDVAAVGAVLFGMIPGYALQRVITGAPDKKTYLAGLRALLAS